MSAPPRPLDTIPSRVPVGSPSAALAVGAFLFQASTRAADRTAGEEQDTVRRDAYVAAVLSEEEKASRLARGWRICAWCREPTIPPEARSNRITCSKPCRQAKQRFNKHIRRVEHVGEPMRFAYADPPYPGLSKRYYGDHRDFNGEVDHEELVGRLVAGNYDGWALSTSAEALRDVWALCPPETRLCVWVNGPRKTKSYTALHAYEAVLLWGGRPRREPVVADLCDVLQWGGRQSSHPGALVGMKPAAFCNWLFELLGASTGDTLDDFFPGSGAVARAWEVFTSSSPGSDDTSPRIPATV